MWCVYNVFKTGIDVTLCFLLAFKKAEQSLDWTPAACTVAMVTTRKPQAFDLQRWWKY